MAKSVETNSSSNQKTKAKNKPSKPKAKKNKSKTTSAMEKFKMEAANEVGVNLKKDGYNGHLTAKQAGAIGGRMVKKMIDSYKNSHK